MTILQEASTKALDALRKAMQGNLDFDVALEAFEALRTALAQQELPQKERPDFMAGYDAGMADAKRMAQQGEQQPVCHGCGIPAGDVHMSTCKSGKWPSRVSNGDTAALSPVAQEPVAMLFGTLPVYDKPAPQPVGINGLTEAETSASMSVFGLTAPQPQQST